MHLQNFVVAIHVLVALVLIGLILIQRGKGAEAGAAFGSGASQTVFGARGSASFLTRLTAILATVFFCTSLTLAYFTHQGTERKSITDIVMPAAPVEEDQSDVPVVPKSKESPAPDAPAGS